MAEIMGETEEDPRYIYLIRHGETELNAQDRLRGWSNPPLNANGLEDADNAAMYMHKIPLNDIYISDLRRAVQTAVAIMKLQGGQFKEHITENLRPIDFGQYNGQLMSVVGPKMEALQDEWITNPDKQAPGGESWNEFQMRQLAVWIEILENPAQHIAVAAHLRNCIWGICFAMNGGKPLMGEELRMLNRVTQLPGCVSVLCYTKKSGLKILAVNTDKPYELIMGE